MEIRFAKIPLSSSLRCGKYSRLIEAATKAPKDSGVIIPKSLTRKNQLQAFYATARDMRLKVSIKTNGAGQKILFIPNLRTQDDKN